MDNFYFKNMKYISPPYTYLYRQKNNIYKKVELIRNSLHQDKLKNIPIVELSENNINLIKKDCILKVDNFIKKNINSNIKICRELIYDLLNQGFIIGLFLENNLFFIYFFDLISFIFIDEQHLEKNYNLISNFNIAYKIHSNNEQIIKKYIDLIKNKNQYIGIDTDGKLSVYFNNCNPRCLNI